MTLLVLSCLWVLAATGVAMLPVRLQYAPGLALLLAAGVLIWLTGRDLGPWAVGLALLAVLSMFRKPLRHFARRATGRRPEVPR